MKHVSLPLLISVALAFLAFAPFFSAAQVTWTVDDDGPADFAYIQEAVNAANPGDTVSVAEGLYSPSTNGETFPITMKNGIQLTGAGAESCVLDAESMGNVIICSGITDAETRIEGFTIAHGDAVQGGGIYCIDSSLTISKNNIRENTASGGGGIFCNNSTPLIENCIICMNETRIGSFTGSGGGVYLNNNSEGIFSNCVIFSNNAEDDGGGIAHNGSSESIVINSTIVFNTAGSHGYGGGNCVGDHSTSTMVNTILWGNTALGGGQQAVVGYRSHLSIEYSDVEGGRPPILVGYMGSLTWGAEIIDADPGFIDSSPSAPDLHLIPGSPCIDSGTNDAAGLPGFDCDGNPRISDGNGDGIAVTDMGAFEYTPPVVFAIDIDPDTLNLKSKGKWITVYIEPTAGYDAEAIDVTTLELHYNDGSVPAARGNVQSGLFMAKFDRRSVQALLGNARGNVELEITGVISGHEFEGTDVIKVIKNGK